MFQEYILENVKTEIIMVNDSQWLMKVNICLKCFGSISAAQIELKLRTENNTISKKQECCNEICFQNEMHVTTKIYIPKVI